MLGETATQSAENARSVSEKSLEFPKCAFEGGEASLQHRPWYEYAVDILVPRSNLIPQGWRPKRHLGQLWRSQRGRFVDSD